MDGWMKVNSSSCRPSCCFTPKHLSLCLMLAPHASCLPPVKGVKKQESKQKHQAEGGQEGEEGR